MPAKKTLFFSVLMLALLLLLGVLSIPFLTSTAIGQRAAVKLLNRKLDNRAEIKRMTLSWFGPQKLGGVVIKNRQQEVLLHVDQIDIKNSLPSLLWSGPWQTSGTLRALSIEHPLPLMEEGHGVFFFNGKNHLTVDIDAVSPYKTPFRVLIQAAMAKHSTNEGVVDLEVVSPAGSIKGALTIGERIQLQDSSQPLQFNWKVDPKEISTRLLPSAQPTTLNLLKPFQLSGSLSSLDIPLQQNQLHTATLTLETKAKQLHVQNADGHELSLKKIKLQIRKQARTEDLEFLLTGKADDKALHGDFSLTGTVRNPLTPDLSLAMQIKASQLSIPFLALLLPADKTFLKQLITLVGNKIDIAAALYLRSMNGPIQLAVHGDNGDFKLDGKLQGGKLLLNTPLTLVTNASEDLGRDILQPLIPLFSGIMAAEKPLKITIEPERFALPIDNMRLDALSIGQMKIELGVLHFSNHGELAKFLRPFRGKHDEPIVLWFTPLYLSLEHGQVTLKRTDVLITSRYPVALWGTADMRQESINMYIALSSEALNRALNISLPPQQKMTILPLKGKNGRLSLDTSQLKVQIASILAQFLSPADEASPLSDEIATSLEIPLPVATTVPLPWENDPTFKKANEPNEKLKDKKQTQSQLQKKGRALLKRLL